MNRRQLLHTALATGLAAPLGSVMAQQAWPSRPIRAVVSYAPGGGIDLMVRALAPVLGEQVGQTILVENKVGASGNIASSDVIRSAADGHNLLVTSTLQQTVNPLVLKNSPDFGQELVPVAIAGRFVFCLVVRSDFPASNVQELVKLAKERPGRFTYASIGSGSMPHLLGEMFQQHAGIQMVHVPYKGAAPAIQATLAKEVDMTFTASAFQFVESGRLKILGVPSDARLARYPQVPTFTEEGVPIVEGDSWIGAWVRKGTPAKTIQELDKGFENAVANASVRSRFETIGVDPVYMGPAKFRALVEREGKAMAHVIRSRNIVVD